jgi:hypothetical protein
MADTVTQTGLLVTTSTGANQVVLSYTVPVGRTFLLEYFRLNVRSTAPPGNPNPVVFGEWSIESPAGTKLYTSDPIGNVSPQAYGLDLRDPWQFGPGSVVRIVCTPASTTSFMWRANFGGFLQ